MRPSLRRLFVFLAQPTWPARVARFLVGVWVFYFFVANLFLNTRILPALINTNPEKLQIRWSWAWTLWPGEVHVRGFLLRVQDRNIQLSVELPRASTGVNLFMLAKREFHARWVHGEGLLFRLRFRPKTLEETKEHGPLAPPIAGLDFDPVDEIGRPKKVGAGKPDPKTEEKKNHEREFAEEEARQELMEGDPELRKLWRVRVDGIDVGVKQAWIEDYRWDGDGRTIGGFFLRPKLTLEVLPSTIDLAKGALSVGKDVVASDLRLKLDGAIDKMNPERHKGIDFMDFVVAKIAINGAVEDVSFLNHYLRAAPFVKIRGGGGPLDAGIEFSRGQFPDGHLDIRATALEADVLDDRATGAAHIAWEVKPRNVEGDPLHSSLTVEFEKYELRRRGVEKPYVKGAGLKVSAKSRDLTIFDPGARLLLTLDLPRADVPDLSFYNRYLPEGSGVSLDEGSGWIKSHLEYDSERDHGKGSLSLGGNGVSAHVEDLGLKGDLLVDTVLGDARLKEAQSFDIAGSSFSLENVSLSGPAAPLKNKTDWWARVKVPKGRIAVGADPYFAADVSASLRDSAPIVSIVLAQKKPPVYVEAAMRELLDIHDVSAHGTIALGKNRLALDELDLTGRGLEILGKLRVVEKKKNGAAFIRRGAFSAGVRVRDGIDVQLVDPRGWYEKQKASVE